jgi:hypothetical protein
MLERAITISSPKYFRYCITLRVAELLLECLQDRGQMGIGWGFELDVDSIHVPDLIYVSSVTNFDDFTCRSIDGGV